MGYKKFAVPFISALIIALLPYSNAFSRMVTQIMPTLTISEDYSDNLLKTQTNKQEEIITTYGLGFSIGFINKLSEVYFSYNPEYRDYKNLDDRDGFLHKATLNGKFNPTKFTRISTQMVYSGNNSNDTGDGWQNSASISGNTQLTKNTNIDYSENYSRSFDQQERTGNYREHDINETTVGITNQFGENNRIGTRFLYSFDKSATSDADEHKKFNPSGFITYWFTPLNGLDSNLSYENTDFDNSSNDIKTYSGHLKYLRKFSKHFNGFLKYRHSYSQRETGDHEIYHPSLGFDWEVTKDSGISLGIGALIHKWDNTNNDSTDPFLDIDAYKTFNLSKRGSLSITGSSGYTEASDTAAGLGYSVFYQAGAQLNYQLLKHLSSNVFGSYQLNDYQETANGREDNTLTMGGGLSWLPLRWLQFRLSYTYSDFDTDGTTQRGDYTENRAFLSVNFIPEQPVRLDLSPGRQALETELFQH